jgi:Domain of unknown function (DUF4184)
MPMTFPSHQGLILPIVRRWPNSFDALALAVGAAMPDIVDTLLGFSLNGYFKHSYGHSLLGTITLDLAGGLLLTWCIAVLARQRAGSADAPYYVRAFVPKASPSHDPQRTGRHRLSLWSVSVLVGVLSHIGFDLISHDTNLLFYPWYENVHWFPEWWYTIWFEIPALSAFGRTYSVGVFTILWCVLTLLGISWFLQFLRQPGSVKPEPGSNSTPSDDDRLGEFHEV